MKMSKKIRAIASAALISAMVMSMSGMSALAETVTANAPLSYVEMTKTVTTDGKTFAPDETFNFTLSVGAADLDADPVIFAGEENGLYFEKNVYSVQLSKGLVFSASMSEAPKETYSNSANINIDNSKFSKPGIYHYQITETASTYEGITNDETPVRDLYLYVERDLSTDILFAKSLVVSGKAIGTGEGKTSLTYTNDYGKTQDKTHNVIVAKHVTGNQGDKTADYYFNIKVTDGARKNESYYIEYGTADENGNFTSGSTTQIIKSGEETEIHLKHGEAIKIYGLSNSDTYEVTEFEKVSGDLAGYKVFINGEDTTTTKSTGALTTAQDNTKVLYVNNKNVTTPTGIIMSFAPYILVLALAGVFAVMFLRKKREDF